MNKNMEKDTIVLERIHNEIEKINKKESNIYFFVLDTKGNPSGSLAYIYNLALLLHNEGYKVSMLYQEQEEFVGGWNYINIWFTSFIFIFCIVYKILIVPILHIISNHII